GSDHRNGLGTAARRADPRGRQRDRELSGQPDPGAATRLTTRRRCERPWSRMPFARKRAPTLRLREAGREHGPEPGASPRWRRFTPTALDSPRSFPRTRHETAARRTLSLAGPRDGGARPG